MWTSSAGKLVVLGTAIAESSVTRPLVWEGLCGGGGGEEYVRGKDKRVDWRENTGDNEFPKSHISKC